MSLSLNLVNAANNPRLGEENDNAEQVILLNSCYSSGSLDNFDKELTIKAYLEKYIYADLPQICQDYLEMAEVVEEEEGEISFPWYVEENNPIDSDGDMFTDLEEQNQNTDEFSPIDFPWWIDVDGDSYLNSFELSKQSNPLDKGDVPSSSVTEAVTKQITFNWQIYLAIGLGVLLIAFIIGYVIYKEKNEI